MKDLKYFSFWSTLEVSVNWVCFHMAASLTLMNLVAHNSESFLWDLNEELGVFKFEIFVYELS